MTPYYEEDGIQIYCGDCREILPTLPKVDLVLTDPPYGIGLNYGAHDDSPERYWEWFIPTLDLIRSVCPALVMTHRQDAVRWIQGWDHLCVWNKPMAFGYAINGWLAHWEPIFIFGVRPNIQIKADRKPARFDVFTLNTEPNKTGHPCPKPLRLMSELLRTFGGDVILDPFMGSGTTLVAAKQLGRRAIGIELERKYCDIAIERLRQSVLPLAASPEAQPEQQSLLEAA
jgi:DNA modification methylase